MATLEQVFEKLAEYASSFTPQIKVKPTWECESMQGALHLNDDLQKYEILFSMEDYIKRNEHPISVLTLAHELGHAIDWRDNHNSNSNFFHRKYSHSYTTRFDYEVRAWVYGAQLLTKFGFEEWDAFEHEAVSCLNTYCQEILFGRIISTEHYEKSMVALKLGVKLKGEVVDRNIRELQESGRFYTRRYT